MRNCVYSHVIFQLNSCIFHKFFCLLHDWTSITRIWNCVSCKDWGKHKFYTCNRLETSPPIEKTYQHDRKLGGIWTSIWLTVTQELCLRGRGNVWTCGGEAPWGLGDPGGVDVMTDRRWDWVSISSDLFYLVNKWLSQMLETTLPSGCLSKLVR